MDLRTIMQIEENRQKCGATPKTNLGLVKKNHKNGKTLLCFGSTLKNWKDLLDLSYYFYAFDVKVNYKGFPR